VNTWTIQKLSTLLLVGIARRGFPNRPKPRKTAIEEEFEKIDPEMWELQEPG
jgi:hypothetical protein